MKALSLSIILLFLCGQSFAQFQGDVFRSRNDAKVIGYGGKEKTLAWAGGINSPQFAMGDLNQDGREDLVIYERGYGPRTFLATSNGEYKYSPQYEASFAPHFYNPSYYTNGYLKLIDYNKDNIPDLFAYGYFGCTAYTGYYDSSVLKFKQYKEVRYDDPNSPGSTISIFVNSPDIPGFEDIDNDGDIDFLSYGFGGNTITWYKNCAKEKGMPFDSIIICVEDDCWGKTVQDTARTHRLHTSCPQYFRTCKRSSAKTTHSGNTLCLIDMDKDGDYDYLNGNISYTDIQYLKNGRSEFGGVDTIIAQDTSWGGSSGNKDVFMPNMPAAFYVDIDHDGDKDLVFSPVDETTLENYKSAAFYENTSTTSVPNFVFRTDTFLVDKMIDKGYGCYPVFYDFNKDGKKDLFIGSDGYYQPTQGRKRSTISYYKNTSTPGNFSFELQTDDFLGLYARDVQGAAIAIGDIDNDTLDDLVIGKTDGTFELYKNTAASAVDSPIWVYSTNALMDPATSKVLDVGDFATPVIYDIDKDGKNDLISGNMIGELYYFNNYSSQAGLVALKEMTKTLGGVNEFDPSRGEGYSVPYIGPMDNTGTDYLVVGTYFGELKRYDGFQSGSVPAKFTMIDSNYSWINARHRAAPAFANVDGDADNLYELVLGNVLGGANFYRQDYKVSVKDINTVELKVSVYPNPAKNDLTVSWTSIGKNKSVIVQLISVTGQNIAAGVYPADQSAAHIDISSLSPGVYYAIVQSQEERVVKPVTILR
ncbi:MAG: T9SS type A sorting domain-containing protein [Chitinophagales bacterium]|nr:T9SS type A sorting domain-containing protein [Chitinophagaceae bacterium]MCB9065886.1 T9SS type A sorting domain-containing protein [Chitinophagales bacterium]